MNMMKKILLVGIMLLGIMMVVPGVLAGNTAVVTGNLPLNLTLTVTGTSVFGDMQSGDNIVVGTAANVTVNVVSNAPWYVSVSDAQSGGPVSTPGKMAEWNVGTTSWVPGGKVLTNALNVGPDGNTYYALSGDPSTALWTGDFGTFDNFPYFKQTIGAADTRVGNGHTYRIVTTFTATAP
jgi:hypothetical protein